jgi:ATP-dependent DNA ligase
MKVIPRDPAFDSTRRSSDFLLPLDTPPMEAKAADAIPEGDGWQYERKWDGFRCLAFRQDDAVELRAKSGKPLGRYFPELVATLKEAVRRNPGSHRPVRHALR